jgi:phosphatidate cytidylyltransferase
VFVWLADSGAYFIGKKFGQTKIFPKGSPNKTFAGFFGGYLSAIIMAIIVFYNVPQLESINFIVFLVLASVLYLFAVYGDLFESVIKRLQGVKDSGQLIPGHGGILDRLDSLYATVPVYTLILTYYLF